MAAPSPLSTVLDAAERAGKLNLRTEEIRVALPESSPDALRQALYRQQQRGRLVRVSRGADHWLIVPLQYAAAGAPPLEMWLDRYLAKTLQESYYVALLSAAETYGASPYAVMVTQVMVPKRRRSITVGRHELVFHTNVRVEHMPTRWHETPDGRFRVSTAELTALELVQRETLAGGMSRVRDVLSALWPSCTPEGFAHALEAFQEIPTAQRLGALLTLDDQNTLAAVVARWLQGQPMRTVWLTNQQMKASSTYFDTDFKVRWSEETRSANT